MFGGTKSDDDSHHNSEGEGKIDGRKSFDNDDDKTGTDKLGLKDSFEANDKQQWQHWQPKSHLR